MLWRDIYATGDEAVDNEHKEIFAMVQRILDDDFKGRPDKIKKSVDFLVDYVARHFGHEEHLMDESDFPDKETHIKEHVDFVASVQSLMERVENNLDSIDLSMEINQTIVGWLAEHTMNKDKKMADYYKAWKVTNRRPS